jgi:GNAT superfamily N-acetyltransferase
MMTLRPAAPAHASEIARVQAVAMRAAYGEILPPDALGRISEEELTLRWTATLQREPRSTLLAVSEEGIIGFAASGESRDEDARGARTGELRSLYVLPDHWGNGTASRLWRATRRALLVEEFPEATLWVLADNTRGRAFYEREGLVLDGAERITEIFGPPVRKVRYRVRLG